MYTPVEPLKLSEDQRTMRSLLRSPIVAAHSKADVIQVVDQAVAEP